MTASADQNDSTRTPLQTGGHTVAEATAAALGLQRWRAGRALERLKKDLVLPNNHHGKIMSNGDYADAKVRKH